MFKILSFLWKEKCRKWINSVKTKPIMGIGILGAVFTMIYYGYVIFINAQEFSAFFEQPYVIMFFTMYTVAKIVNPTQGMIIDYQLLEMKLIRFSEYKILIGMKLLGGSILLLILFHGYLNKMLLLIMAINGIVNLWIFLRSKIEHNVLDFLLAIYVIIGMKYQIIYLSFLLFFIFLMLFVCMQNVDYEEILPLYRLMYRLGQYRQHGGNNVQSSGSNMQTQVENVIGKAKKKQSQWCEKYYSKDAFFAFAKEISRVKTNATKIFLSFLVSLFLGCFRFYFPAQYDCVVYLIVILVAVSYDFMMNRSEAVLLQRGFVCVYSLNEIFRKKIPVYFLMNLLFFLPICIFDWRQLLISVGLSFVIVLFSLCKCFKT